MIGPASFKIAKSTAVSKDAFVVPCVCDTFAYISGKGESTNLQIRFRIPMRFAKIAKSIAVWKVAFVVPCVCDTFAYISGKGESNQQISSLLLRGVSSVAARDPHPLRWICTPQISVRNTPESSRHSKIWIGINFKIGFQNHSNSQRTLIYHMLMRRICDARTT